MVSTCDLKCASTWDERSVFDCILHAPQSITERIVNLGDGVLTQVAGVFRTVHSNTEVNRTSLREGERVVANLAKALVDVSHALSFFPELYLTGLSQQGHFGPDVLMVNPRRPHKEHLSFVTGAHM